MKTNNGWLEAWEAETEERRALAAPVLTRDLVEEPDVRIDDFGGRHCAECSTVHGEPDACPGCGAPVA